MQLRSRRASLFQRVWNNHRYNFLSRLSMSVRVNVVLNRTVVADSDWRFHKPRAQYSFSESTNILKNHIISVDWDQKNWLPLRFTLLSLTSMPSSMPSSPFPLANTKNSRSRAFVPTCCNSPLESKNIDKINTSLWLKSSGESPLCPILLFRRCNFDEPDWPIQTCHDNKLLLERFRVTFTPNGQREFVPHDQVFP